MADSSWMWVGLVAVFGIILLYVGIYNSEAAYLERAKQYANTLYEINEKGLMYEKEGNHPELERQAKLMQQNLKRISQEALKLDITLWDEYELYFPLRHASDIKSVHDDVEEICDVGPAIPMHLHEISKTERFKIFFSKYSQFPVVLDVMDERKYLSSLHYGLIVNSTNGKYASTYFHVSTCTNGITDEYAYVLSCRDETKDYFNSAITKEDFVASIAHDDFCIIPLDSWRQSLHDYGKEVGDIGWNMMEELADSVQDHESQAEFHKKIQRWDLLQEISNQYYNGDIEKAEQKTQEYTLMFGDLPEDLQDIIDGRPAK